jgi:thiamine biosynthesis lipoprotein ApbE
MAGSGMGKGKHIISPTNYKPVQHRLGAWSMAKTGADADALSTSFMIMDEADIQKFVKNNSDFGGMVVDEKGSVLMIGNWD